MKTLLSFTRCSNCAHAQCSSSDTFLSAVESMMNHREILSVPVYRKQQSVKYVQFWLFRGSGFRKLSLNFITVYYTIFFF